MSFKLGILRGDQWVEHSHAPTFARQDMGGGRGDRLHVGVPGGDTNVFRNLLECLEPPHFLLYVLHTPRGEAEPGRYQSPELSREQVSGFLKRYSGFLKSDARFDLWVHSPESHGTIVWDHHNVIYAYGPLDCYEAELRKLGFSSGLPSTDFAHEHHYREECDADARAIFDEWEWRHGPLQPQDGQ